MYLHDSHLADFVRMVCFPFLTLVFLLALFLVRIRRISPNPVTRTIFRGIRVAALAGLAVFAVAVFWPRSYGAPIRTKSADLRYWNLPTGSHIAYRKLPAKGTAKPTPIIYLQGGPGGTIDGGLVKIMTPIADEGYDIYLYDQLGCGWSNRLDNIRGYTVTRHVRDLESIVQAIGARKVDPRPKLKNSPIPILVMKGQYDNQKWGFTNEYLQLFPNHQLAIIPNAGHGIFIEQPEIYLATIRDFLKKQQ